ncbi:MAG TPA: peptidoglycan-binding protein [Polyangiaceae bacterium]|nr:peptidoglycan-binding protein [Polyangiaceae bacterium]
MVPYVIRQGDFLTKLAQRLGVDAETVWNDPKNADLKKRRKSFDVLCPGDLIYLPDPKRTWMPLKIGTVNQFTGTVAFVEVQIKLAQEGAPLANTACHVEGIGDPIDLTTDGAGLVTFKVPVECTTAVIVLDDPPARYAVRLGHMDPEDETSGVRSRLGNLGYLDDAEAGGDSVASSVQAFQSDSGLETTGVVDDATRKALVDRHGH